MREDNASSLSRRDFCKLAAGAGIVLAAGAAGVLGDPAQARAQGLANPPLPYPENALEPVISARTVSFHYGKHTQAYYDNTAKLTADTPLSGKPLAEIVIEAAKLAAADPAKAGLFNNAAQSLNHTFYWAGMKQGGGGQPTGKLAEKIVADFGSLEAMAKEFSQAAATQFGSGWAWLALDGGKLKVVKTGNAETPLTKGMTPLLTLDVWEHAYYLDYQNRRADYIAAFWDKLVNWDAVARNLG